MDLGDGSEIEMKLSVGSIIMNLRVGITKYLTRLMVAKNTVALYS
jgi:hypothetical protein